VWWLFDDRRLSRRVRALLRDSELRVLVSTASAWEIATKHRLGRLDAAAPLVHDFCGWVTRAGFTELAIQSEHAITAGRGRSSIEILSIGCSQRRVASSKSR
jgi:PIN domain nuclease of toxin-antitoxin system